MAYSFIFGGDGMPKTPQELEQMRAVARSLVRNRRPQNVGDGIASIGDAIAYRMMTSRADKAEKSGIESANSAFSGLFDGMLNPAESAAPVDAAVPAAVPTIASPQDAIDASPQKPLTGDLAQTEAYIRQAAEKRGINPDYAVKVARSEGLSPGVWQSRVKKGDMFEPSYGPFQMLVGDGKTFPKGMGNDFQERTGLDPRDPKNVNQMIDFALDTAKRDGWRQWYGAKKVGVNRWDGINANEVASLDAAVPAPANQPVDVVPVPEGFQQPDPLAKPTVKVAQALQKKQPGFDVMKAVEVMNNPFLEPGKKAVAETLIKRHFAEQDRLAEEERKKADPKYKLDLEKGRLELDILRNPKQARRMTDEQEKEAGLDTSGVYEIMPDGSTKTVQEPKKRNTATVDGRVVDTDTGKVIADFSQPTADWDKLDDGRLFNKRSGEIKDAAGKTVGFRFPGNSVEAAALNGLIENGTLTEQQAMDIAAGKQMTGPNGENLFIRPQALIGADPSQPAQNEGIDIFGDSHPDQMAATPARIKEEKEGVVTVTGPKGRFDDATSLRKEIQQLPSYKNLAQSMPIYRSMAETAGRNSKASDLNLVYGLGKIMDPTSVVREGEMVMVKNTASIPDWLQGAIAQINGGAALTPETRQAIMREAYGRVKGYDSQFQLDAEMYRGVAQRNQFNEADIIPSFGEYAPWTPADEKAKPAEDIGPTPEGLTDLEWKHMSPEDRKLWQN